MIASDVLPEPFPNALSDPRWRRHVGPIGTFAWSGGLEGDKIPRKGGPGIVKSDLRVINQTTNLKTGDGLSDVIGFLARHLDPA